jgi:DNA-binding HxlR family transcriptional regulator
MANDSIASLVPRASAPTRDACAPDDHDPRIARLMNHLIGRVAAKWTILVLETLDHRGRLRFHELQRAIPGVSQKVLTGVLRQMERDGLVLRTIHAEIPPRVDYALTPMGATLGQAFCGVWLWAKQHLVDVEASREAFDRREATRSD